jgi:hypothetical protein
MPVERAACNERNPRTRGQKNYDRKRLLGATGHTRETVSTDGLETDR